MNINLLLLGIGIALLGFVSNGLRFLQFVGGAVIGYVIVTAIL